MFTAPGEQEEPLPIPPSIWHFERSAQIPLEHWNLIVEFAETLNPQYAVLLDQTTNVTDPDDWQGRIILPADQIQEAIRIIHQVQQHLASAPPLVPVATEEIPDTFTNEDHIRMLDAVVAVFEEWLRRGEPFEAWLD